MSAREQARTLGALIALASAALAPGAHADPVPPSGRPAPAVAPGGDAGSDAVHLKDGAVLRGTIVELVAGDHLSVKLATGQLAVVRWDAIDHVTRVLPEHAPALGATAPPGGAAQAATAGAVVQIESDRDVQLEQRISKSSWALVCNFPCGLPLALDKEYRIAGPGVRASRPFQLNASPGGRVVLDVTPASRGAFVGGIVLASVGLPVLLVGSLVLLVSALPGVGDDATAVGLVLLLGGAGSVAGGMAMTFGNARSRVVQRPWQAPAPAAPARAVLRGPTWASSVPAAPPSGAWTFPLLVGRF